MACRVIKVGDTVAFVKGAFPTPKKCAFCDHAGTKLCDGTRQLRPDITSKTCDASLCDGCATAIGMGRDLCPACIKAAAALGMTFR